MTAQPAAQRAGAPAQAENIELNFLRDLNPVRLAALEESDRSKFTLFHWKVVVVAGMGFFTDAYDLFAISFAATMLGYVYGEPGPDGTKVLNWKQDLAIKVAAPVGTLFGQLVFGWLADSVGRKRMYGVEMLIILTGTFAQAISGANYAISIVGVLVIWRFIMGIGVGGDYPLSAVIASESAAVHTRGRLMVAVFSSQGWGNFVAVLVSFILVTIFKPHLEGPPDFEQLKHLDYMWRILLGIGCIPAGLGLFFRLTIPETGRFRMDIERNVVGAAAEMKTVRETGEFDDEPAPVVYHVEAPQASWSDFKEYFGKWENGKVLLGTAYSWFSLDLAFYGLNLNSPVIISGIAFGSPTSSASNLGVFDNLRNIAVGNLILSVAGLIPGYYLALYFIDTWGRKPMQYMGFSVLAGLFVIMGFSYNQLTASTSGKDVFILFYCLANLFQNFGPNTTTFLIPGEVFPTRYRSTAHGISAASGKFGAIVTQTAFSKAGKGWFFPHILEIYAFFMLTGLASTYLLPETMGRTLEDLSNESQENFIKVRREGDPEHPPDPAAAENVNRR
ncbi:Phosphate permease [Mycena chlorophos]|uniref:Phosphate permease n=1 Tax=Mycena chlorophos TaxID=658473 RepID=A0A8H6WL29_MYCCL|nr:Phosphate permease [Mycena chlorophos]